MKTQVSKMTTGRRKVLAGVGASGLAMAAAVFGRSTPAHAANHACCALIFVPPNVSYSSCVSGNHYLWQCTFGTVGPVYRYNCCEKKNSLNKIIGSAARYTCIANCG